MKQQIDYLTKGKSLPQFFFYFLGFVLKGFGLLLTCERKNSHDTY